MGLALFGVVMIELEGIADAKTAAHRFEDLQLPASRMISMPFSDGMRFYAVLDPGQELEGCLALYRRGQQVAFFHGTDCDMTQAITRDMRLAKKQSDFIYCSRRLAGGVFEKRDIDDWVVEFDGNRRQGRR